MLIGLAHAAFAQSDTVARWQHDIDQGDLGQLAEDLSRFISQAGLAALRLKRFPEHIGEKADQDVSLQALLLLVQTGRICKSDFWMRKASSASVSWI